MEKGRNFNKFRDNMKNDEVEATTTKEETTKERKIHRTCGESSNYKVRWYI